MINVCYNQSIWKELRVCRLGVGEDEGCAPRDTRSGMLRQHTWSVGSSGHAMYDDMFRFRADTSDTSPLLAESKILLKTRLLIRMINTLHK